MIQGHDIIKTIIFGFPEGCRWVKNSRKCKMKLVNELILSGQVSVSPHIRLKIFEKIALFLVISKIFSKLSPESSLKI